MEDAGTDYMAESRLRALDESLTDVGDAEGGFVGGCYAVVDDGGEVEGDVVLCHADLFGDLCEVLFSGVKVGFEIL